MSNIRTIHTIKKKQSPMRGQYRKDKTYRNTIKDWYSIAEVNSDIGEITIMPTETIKSKEGVKAITDEEGNVLHYGALTQIDRPAYQRWSNDKMDLWRKATSARPALIEQGDYGLAINISGGVGVLDFDCEKAWNWFNDTFDIDLSKYFVHSNISSDHNCGCESESEKTYHLYFKKTEWFNVPVGRVIRCIGDKPEPVIDFLQQTSTGTPQVVKIPSGQDDRKIEHRPEDLKFIPLPALVIHHFKTNWKRDIKEERHKKRNYKYVELVKSIPHENLDDEGGKTIRSLYRELYLNNVDVFVIQEVALTHLKDVDYVKYKKTGGEYSIDETKEWIQSLCDSCDADEERTDYTINRLCKEYALDDFNKIQNKWLRSYGSRFDTDYIKDVSYYIGDAGERAKLIKKYYNHFIFTTTGISKNRIYYREYDIDGNISNIGHYQNKEDFTDYCGISVMLPEGTKEKCYNSAKWWFDGKYNSYHKTIFKPHGILHDKAKEDKKIFNVFKGFKMKYLKHYKGDAKSDKAGDLINRHLREVLCWDNKTDGGVDEIFYNFVRGWLYKSLCKGDRTGVALVFYSAEKGTGKSLFTNGYMKHCIGETYSNLVNNFNKMMKDQFTDYFEDLCLMVVEEMPNNSHKSQEAWEFMKSVIETDVMACRKFQTAPDKMNVFFNMLILTNNIYSVCKEFFDRRGAGNRVSNKYRGNDDYFTPVAKAMDSYDAWENFIHRYIIADYHSFSHIKVINNSTFLPKTNYRQTIMRRGNDNVLYFLKEVLENMTDYENEEDPFGHQIGQRIFIKDLFDLYKFYKSSNNIESCIITNQEQFKEKLTTRYNIEFVKISQKQNPTPIGNTEGKNIISTKRFNRGEAIVITAEFIKSLQELIRDNTIQTEDIILETEAEIEDKRVNLSINNSLNFIE